MRKFLLMIALCVNMTAMFADEPLARFGLLADPQYADAESVCNRNYREGKNLIKGTLELFNQEERLDFVCNLGDIVDGRLKGELEEVLEVFKLSKFPVKHAIGNHDMRLQSKEDLQKAFGEAASNYQFKAGGVRFLVLHTLEASLMQSKDTPERAEADAYLLANRERRLEDFNGMMSATGMKWLEHQLAEADALGEPVIVMTHLPIYDKAAVSACCVWNDDEMLRLVDAHPCLKAWFAGHHHHGGIAVRKGVLHKTVKGLCELKDPTGLIVSVFQNRIEIKGLGAETDFTIQY